MPVTDEWRPWDPCRENVNKSRLLALPDDNPKNRLALARERSGLSVGQVCELLGLDRDELTRQESAPTIELNVGLFASMYGVSVEWLTGQVPRYNYDAIKDVPGYDDLSPNDRDTVAEFAASLPPHRVKRPPPRKR